MVLGKYLVSTYYLPTLLLKVGTENDEKVSTLKFSIGQQCMRLRLLLLVAEESYDCCHSS